MNSTVIAAPTDAVVVDYQVDGEPTAVAVARGESRLVGISLAGISVPQHRVTGEFSAAVWSLGTRRRVYRDSIFARTIERVFGLPQVDGFDDLGTMIQLLDVAGLWDSATDGRPTAWSDDECSYHATHLLTTLPARLVEAGLYDAYSRVEIPVVDSIVDMTINGMPVDPGILAQVEAHTAARLDILRHQIAESTGGVNPDHDYQIRTFLYERCGLAVPFLTRTGQRSVCKEALEQLVNQQPVVVLVRDYRSRRDTLDMCRSLARNHCPRTGCVHGTLNPLGASTGRFSCREPNLHGVPSIVRRAVRARDGRMLLEADISQAECRVLAHFTRDPGLVEVFQAGNVDLHKQTMALVLGKAVDDVTPAERKVGKAVNFGIIYGKTEHGLSRQLRIGVAEARGFIDGFFRGRPAVRDWIESIKQQVRHGGYVQTLSGRRRNLPAIWSDNPVAVAEAERQAVNTVIQGTAADLMKLMEERRLLYVAATRAGTQLTIVNRESGGNKNHWQFFAAHTDGRDELEDFGPQLPPTYETVHIDEATMTEAFSTIAGRWQTSQQHSYATAAAKEISVTPSGLHHVSGSGEHGTEWGTVIHFLLEAVMRTPEADCHALARMALAEQGLDPAVAPAAVRVVEQVTSSDVWVRALNSKQWLVEVPFVTHVSAEQSTTGLPTMLRGVIDLAFEEQDGWVVVDYKTDAVTEGRLQSLVDHYQGQVATYASVWQAMLGQEVKESGLYFTSSDQYVTV